MTRSLFILVVLALGLTAAPGRALEVARVAPRPPPDGSYAEVFTAAAQLEDGTYALAQLLFTHAGIAGEKALCRALVVPALGDGSNEALTFGSDGWAYETAKNRLTVGPCTLQAGTEGALFHVKTEHLDIAMELSGPLTWVKPPGHKTTNADGKMLDADLLAPWAKVRADVTGSGPAVHAKGFATFDHSRSDALLPTVAQSFVRFRAYDGADPVILLLRVPV